MKHSALKRLPPLGVKVSPLRGLSSHNGLVSTDSSVLVGIHDFEESKNCGIRIRGDEIHAVLGITGLDGEKQGLGQGNGHFGSHF